MVPFKDYRYLLPKTDVAYRRKRRRGYNFSLESWLARRLSIAFGLLPGHVQLRAIILIYRFTNKTFFLRRYLATRGRRDVDILFHSRLPKLFPDETLEILRRLGANKTIREMRFPPNLSLEDVYRADSEAHLDELFNNVQFDLMKEELAKIETGQDGIWKYEALIAILDEVPDEKLSIFLLANLAKRPEDRRPHQNLADRTERSYTPNDLDFVAAGEGAIFDICNYLGQRLVHVGRGDLGIVAFTRALEAQERLRSRLPQVSPALENYFSQWGITLEKLRIAPQEWTTQIGHAGFLDFLIRMQSLGWWEGQLVILASEDVVANRACLSLFSPLARILVKEQNISASAWDELSSLQRWCGLNFNVGRLPHSDEVVNWPDLSALAAQEWSKQPRSAPLRESYDTIFGSDLLIQEAYLNARKSWGLDPKDWFVCLHMREPTFYGETNASGQAHRNAEIDTYLDAIKFIIAQGGNVIRLGSPTASALPDLPHLIDYAKSEFKSPVLDLQLIYGCRFFIGTTSGLGNVANSFGVPMALVNCITVDGQLWHENVRFALKTILNSSNRALSQQELIGKHRWSLFAYESLLRNNLLTVDNESDEILEIVKEVSQIASGEQVKLSDADLRRLTQWQDSLPIPYFYGASRPSRYFLEKHESTFLKRGTECDTCES